MTQTDKLYGRVGASLLVRAFGAVCGLLLQIVLARLLGVEASGTFYLTIAIMTGVTTIAKLGLDTSLVRDAGTAWARKDFDTTSRIYIRTFFTCAISGSIFGLVLFLGSHTLAISIFGKPGLENLIRISAFMIAPLTCIWVQSGLLKAIQRPAAATLIDVCLMPSLGLMSIVFLQFSGNLNLELLFIFYLAAMLITLATGMLFINRDIPLKALTCRNLRLYFPNGCLNLTTIEFINFTVAAGILPLLAMVSTAIEFGIFNAAFRMSVQAGMVVLIMGSVLSPRFASHYAESRHEELEKEAKRGTLLMCLMGMPLLLPMLFFPEIMVLLFGIDFAPAMLPLQILAAGQIINILCGPTGYLLAMTGHERELRNILISTTIFGLLLSSILGSYLGATGAAIGCATTLVLQNSANLFMVWRRLGFIPIPIPVLSSWKLGNTQQSLNN